MKPLQTSSSMVPYGMICEGIIRRDDFDRKKPPPPGGFPIYHVPSSRTVCRRGVWQISSVAVVLSKFFFNSKDLDPTQFLGWGRHPCEVHVVLN